MKKKSAEFWSSMIFHYLHYKLYNSWDLNFLARSVESSPIECPGTRFDDIYEISSTVKL